MEWIFKYLDIYCIKYLPNDPNISINTDPSRKKWYHVNKLWRYRQAKVKKLQHSYHVCFMIYEFHIDTITEAVLTPCTCQLTSVSPSFSSARGAECAAESPQRRRSWRCSPRRRGSFHGPRAVTQLRESRSLSLVVLSAEISSSQHHSPAVRRAAVSLFL